MPRKGGGGVDAGGTLASPNGRFQPRRGVSPYANQNKRGLSIREGLRVPGKIFFILTLNSDNAGGEYI
jgi:hypothetical protein